MKRIIFASVFIGIIFAFNGFSQETDENEPKELTALRKTKDDKIQKINDEYINSLKKIKKDFEKKGMNRSVEYVDTELEDVLPDKESVENDEWISKDATYKISSTYRPPQESFLDDNVVSKYGSFETKTENDSGEKGWVIIKLSKPYVLTKIEIYNTGVSQERLVNASIYGSIDGDAWKKIDRLKGVKDVYMIKKFNKDNQFQYIKIQLAGGEGLQLRKVKIYGH